MIHPIGCSGIGPGQSAAILCIGGFLLAALLARTQGDLSLIVVEMDERKRQLTKRLGALSSTFITADEFVEMTIWDLRAGLGVDLAIEASSSSTTVHLEPSAVRRGGTLLQVRIPTGPVSLPLGQKERTSKMERHQLTRLSVADTGSPV